MVASQNGHVEVVDKLLQHGAKADLQKNVSKNNVAYWLQLMPTPSHKTMT